MATPDSARGAFVFRLAIIAGLCLLVCAYVALWVLGQPDITRLGDFWSFFGVGLLGALIANSTGVGGGVVFVPAFSMLRETGVMDLSPSQTVGVSFAIQSFGMSVGSLTWLSRLRAVPDTPMADMARLRIVAICAPLSIAALIFTQLVIRPDPAFAFILFKAFSIVLGLTLLAQLLFSQKKADRQTQLTATDLWALAVIGLVGGVATAMFSVGVGELMALYLFLRRYPLEVCVPPAVIVSALSVIAGTPYHIGQGNLVFEILIYAAPAVMLGGFLARRLAHALGAFLLKLCAAIWIVASSLVLIAMSF